MQKKKEIKPKIESLFLHGFLFGLDNFASILMLLMIFLVFKDFPVMVMRQFLKEINSPYIAIIPALYVGFVLAVLMPWVFYITFQRYYQEKIKFGVLFRQPRFVFSLMTASILYFLGVALGLFLIFPGIWVATRYFFYPHFLYKGASIKSAFAQSAQLTQGLKVRIFLLFFTASIILITISASTLYLTKNIMIAIAGINFLSLLSSIWFEYIRTYMFCKLIDVPKKKMVEKPQQPRAKITSSDIFSSIIEEARIKKNSSL